MGENHRSDPSWSYLAMTAIWVITLVKALLGVCLDMTFRVKMNELTFDGHSDLEGVAFEEPYS